MVPLAYQNQQQFTEISHFNLSITNKPQISSLISAQKTHNLSNSRAQLVNNKKSLFAETQPEIQLSSLFSTNSIENSKTSSTMSQQVPSMKGKSASNRSAELRLAFPSRTTQLRTRPANPHRTLISVLRLPIALKFSPSTKWWAESLIKDSSHP